MAWAVALLLVFPLAWLFLTAFKTELQAIAVPPLLSSRPRWRTSTKCRRSDYLLYAKNSVITSVLSTLLGLLLAAPAGYAMAFQGQVHQRHPDVDALDQDDARRGRAGAHLRAGAKEPPARYAARADHRVRAVQPAHHGLDAVFALQGHPARDPGSRPHGRRHCLWQEVRLVLLPWAWAAWPPPASLCLVLSWNEAFWSLNLSAAKAGTLATLIASYSSPEGLFWAKLSAASLMAIAPIVVFGWFSQKQLVQGLTFGAVK